MTVKAKDEPGEVSGWSPPLTVHVNEAPVADFSYSPQEPDTEDTVQFTDQSYDPDGSIQSWSWEFGDGSTSTSQNTTHSYAAGGSYTVTLTVTDDDGRATMISKTIQIKGIVLIRMAALKNSLIVPDNFLALEQMEDIFNDFEWAGANNIYRFKLYIDNPNSTSDDVLTPTEVINGELTRDNYDVFIIPGIARQYAIPKTTGELDAWRDKVQAFVADGGGYIGICGGAVSSASYYDKDLSDGYLTFMERIISRSLLGIIDATVVIDFEHPYVSSTEISKPSATGQVAYTLYNVSDQQPALHGVPLTVTLNNSHLVMDCFESQRMIRWWGGPAFVPHGDTIILAWYPSVKISDGAGGGLAPIHYWDLNSSASDDTAPCPVTSSSSPTDEELDDYLDWVEANDDGWSLMDFDPTDEWVETYLASRPAIVANPSYGAGGGRAIAFGPHPEDQIWRNDVIQDEEDNSSNTLTNGLYTWQGPHTDYASSYGYNWRMLRRAAAWVADGVPDTSTELP